MIIAIDGPAAAGKGTLARRLAQHLNFAYLDTGLIYRAVAKKVLRADEVGLHSVAYVDDEEYLLADPSGEGLTSFLLRHIR